jgi:alpha-L-fucosidase
MKEGWLEIRFRKPVSFNTLVLVEPVGQSDDYAASRIAEYRFQSWNGVAWVDVVNGALPSRVQIHAVDRAHTSRLRVVLTGKRDDFHVAEIGVYDEPGRG